MAVYFRTGRASGVSIPWAVYLFVVLPLQIVWYGILALALLARYLLLGLIGVAAWTADRISERRR